MLLDEAIRYVDRVISNLETELPKISEELALNASALVINRIQQEGLPGRTYSKVKLPVFYFIDRELNGGGRSLIEKHRKKKGRERDREAGLPVRANRKLDEMEDGISYEEWRETNGLQVNHVDLTFTGRTFQNVGIIGTTIVEGNYVTIIGGLDKEVKDKLRWNAERFGDYFQVIEDERDELTRLLQIRMEQLKTRSLNG